MSKEELREFLKENLKIEVEKEFEEYCNNDKVTVSLSLCGEVIDRDYFYT